MPQISLRPAVASDAPFAYRVEDDAMRSYAEQTWGRWNPGQDPDGFVKAFAVAGHSVIEVDRQAAGILAIEEHPTYVFLGKLYLLASYRNAGVGAQVLGLVLASARAKKQAVKLRVLAVNARARAFYASHGFKVEKENSEHVYMASGCIDKQPLAAQRQQ